MKLNFNIRGLLLILLLCMGVPFGFPPAHANPKGTIAFLSNRNNPDEPGLYTAIYLINADGTNERLWLENPEGFFGMAWSPNGKSVALAQYDADGRSHIFVKDLRTGQQKNITAQWVGWRLSFGQPSWSPDGKWLAVLCSKWDVIHYDVCRITADGDQLQILTREAPGIFSSSPSWSPHGDKIAFTREAKIFVMDRNGGNQVRLSQLEGIISDRRPAWSPDGRWIAFRSLRDGTFKARNRNWNIYIMDANGENEMRVTDHPGSEGSPTWVIPDRSLPVDTRGNRATFRGHLKSERR